MRPATVLFAAVLAAGCGGHAHPAERGDAGAPDAGARGCTPGAEQACGPALPAPCAQGKQWCDETGHWAECVGAAGPQAETCNGIDDDCDGTADDHLNAPPCGEQRGVCAGSTQPCLGAQGYGACGPAQYGPGYEPVETACDGLDNDCDGQVDEGCVSTLASGAPLSQPEGVVLTPSGWVVADVAAHQLLVVPPGGGAATVLAGDGTAGLADGPAGSAEFDAPTGLAWDGVARILYVADAGNHALRAIDAARQVTTLAGGHGPGFLDGPASGALFDQPSGLALMGGALYVADRGNNRVRVVTGLDTPSTAQVGTLAGAAEGAFVDGDAATARFHSPTDLAAGADGALYVADSLNCAVRRVDLAGNTFTTAGAQDLVAGVIVPRCGFADGPPGVGELSELDGIAALPTGELLVADTGNLALRRVHTDRALSTETPQGGSLGTASSGPRRLALGAGANAAIDFADVVAGYVVPL